MVSKVFWFGVSNGSDEDYHFVSLFVVIANVEALVMLIQAVTMKFVEMSQFLARDVFGMVL